MEQHGVSRRAFLTSSGAAAVLPAAAAQERRAKAPLRFGLIGCGGRGRYVATQLIQHGDAQIVALADLVSDRVDAAHKQFDEILKKRGQPSLAASRLYRGVDSGPRLINSDVDAVLIAIIPYFYPGMLAEAVAAGKHVYCEKPVATDVAGALRVMDLARRAEGSLVFHVGFQLRVVPALEEMVRRIHAGAIGRIVSGEGCFLYGGGRRQPPPGLSPAEARIRLWPGDRILSGDIIVEQNVHSIDKLNWVMRGHPEAAVATGGRGARDDFGDVWDHYNALIHYANNVTISFRSTQFLRGWTDVAERFFGPKGSSESHYDGPVRIHGDEPWDAGVTGTRVGAEVFKSRLFVNDILSGNLRNEGRQGAESALSAMLVRAAAYERREVTWDQLLASNQKWDPHINLAALA